MLIDWIERDIGELGRVVTGKTPPTKVSDNFGGGAYPFITIPDLDGRVYIDNTDRSLSELGASAIRNQMIPKNSVMMSCIATVGRCGIATRDSFTNQQINTLIPKHDISPRFLFYKFRLLGNELKSIGGGGSIYTNVSKSGFSKIKLHLPAQKKLQEQIADSLYILDNKIASNNQMNETLEEMAKAIFKSWFVDFDPVHAKAAGKQPAHMDSKTAALFPSTFGDDSLPRGWSASSIGDEVGIYGGGTPSTKEPAFWEGGQYNWCTPKDLSSLASPVLLETAKKVTESGLKKISSGLLPEGTLLMSSRAPIGYLAITRVPTAVNQGFIAMKCDKRISNLYTLFWCQENMERIKNNAGGTTFDEINKSNFKPISILLPTSQIMSNFDALSRPLFLKIVSNLKENQTLAEMRDTLMPKLMSGEIRVKDAEREVGKSV